MSKRDNYDYLFKILLVGDTGTGKSSILSRFVDNTFTSNFISTIGVDFKIRTLTLPVSGVSRVVKLQIWDTAGQERFRTITTSYYRGGNGIILVFDLTDLESFNNLEKWLQEINRYCREDTPILVVGNKTDQPRVVPSFNIQNFLDEHSLKGDYLETSAKTGDGVDSIFNRLVEKLVLSQKFDSDKDHQPLLSKNINRVQSVDSSNEPVARSGCC